MTIKFFKIAYGFPDYHPAYIVEDMRHASTVCRLLNTNDTIWSEQQIDELRKMAAEGKADFVMTQLHCATFTLKEPLLEIKPSTPECVTLAIQKLEGLLDDDDVRICDTAGETIQEVIDMLEVWTNAVSGVRGIAADVIIDEPTDEH